ncbi:MAG: hypothetical protein ACLGGY_00015 [Gammaproteobacteria bacterium]
MRNALLILVSVSAGIICTIAYQKYLVWSRLHGTTYVTPQEVPSAAERDVKKALDQVRTRYSLTDEQLAWLIFKNGFHGFFSPIFQKGSVIVGEGYVSRSYGNENYISFGHVEKITGRRSDSQFLLIDKKRQVIVGTVDFPDGENLKNIEFLVFTPHEIQQFSMSSVFGITFDREPAQK